MEQSSPPPDRIIHIADLDEVGRIHLRPSSEMLVETFAAGATLSHVSSTNALAMRRPGSSTSDVPPSQLMQAVHLAFAGHRTFVLSPEVIWYCLVHEVAVHVRQDPDRFADVFGQRPGARSTIEVRDDTLLGGLGDDWGHTIALFLPKLRAAVGEDLVDLFLPWFSTSRRDDEVALAVALLHTTAPYFRYRVRSLCGIPRVRLRGSPDDWYAIAERLPRLAGLFPALEPWLAEVGDVIEIIHASARGDAPPVDFWLSLYKDMSQSGGPDVSGWITTFFAHVASPGGHPTLRSDFWRCGRGERSGALHWDQVPSHLSRVPFVWERVDLGVTHTMFFVGGILGTDADDGLRQLLGWGVGRRSAAAESESSDA